MTRKNIAFPQVLRNAEMDSVCIVYWKKAEYYGGPHKGCDVVNENGCNDGDEKFSPFTELQMCLDNGFKFVHPARDNRDEIEALRDEYVKELEDTIKAMKDNCPEGGCLVGENR